MRSQIKLGRVFGITIGLHYSWFLIAFLIVFSLVGDYRSSHPQWPVALATGLAVTTALLFFLSLLLHELSHSLMAKTRGLPVHEITLFALGGVSQLGQEAASAKDEFQIAIVGPLTSVVIGIICLGAADSPAPVPVAAMLSWLGYINLGLAFFNMIPGYPMDGGRILRAVIWWKTEDLERATMYAARTGQAIAGVFIIAGIIGYFRGGGLSALWVAFIGWFLLQAARESHVETTLRNALAGIKVSDLMVEDYPTVDSHESIQDFVDHTLLRTGGRSLLVTENGNTVGLVTPHEIKHVDRAKWPRVAVGEIMRPWKKLSTVAPGTPMLRALEIINREDIGLLPVVSNGQLDGVLPREKLFDYLQTVLDLQYVRNGYCRKSV